MIFFKNPIDIFGPDAVYRLKRIDIRGFKNVKAGAIVFPVEKADSHASVLGLYGQNGSGKTALVNVLSIVKTLMMGDSLDPSYLQCLDISEQQTHVEVEFCIESPKGDSCCVRYSFTLGTSSGQETNPRGLAEIRRKLVVGDEVLSCSIDVGNYKQKMQPIIDARSCPVFGPKSKFRELVPRDSETESDLIVEKKMAAREGRSFVFSPVLAKKILECALSLVDIEDFSLIEDTGLEKIPSAIPGFNLYTASAKVSFSYPVGKYSPVFSQSTYLSAMDFAMNRMFVIDSHFGGDEIPIFVRFPGYRTLDISVTTDGMAYILGEVYPIIKKAVTQLSSVIEAVIPGLQIDLIKGGELVDEEGRKVMTAQLVSYRDGLPVAFSSESYGVRKLCAILQLLVDVYNNPACLVVIDELDSGVFEYLLGEIIRIVANEGMGQLVFTSHNLRLLETLPPKDIAFTTTNPNNRYVRMKNVKSSNNLRDFYYRDIVLGGQEERLYESTNNSDISMAFMLSGIPEMEPVDGE